MKLPELKAKFKNKYVIRIVAGVLVVAMVGTGASVSSVYAAKNTKEETVTEAVEDTEEDEDTTSDEEEDLKNAIGSITVNEKEIGKEETVYLIADSTGKVKTSIVSDHLINNDGKKTIEDASNLEEIENVKGKETFTKDGNKLTWQADGNDIYYQGTSTEEAPITQKLTYYLDGKEVTPEELAGKSGKVTMRFDYTNNEKVQAKIDGKNTDIYVPFMAVSGMILDDSFQNIEVTNGKVMADGNNSIVVGYALPGLKDSLDVDEEDFDEDISIPDYFEVTAEVENFELGMTMTAVVNATNFISAESGEEESSIDELLDKLTDATEQLQDGSNALADGVDTLKSSLGEFSDGMNSLKDGIKNYTDGANQIADGISQISDKAPTLSTGVNTLNGSAASISNGVALLDNTLNTTFSAQEKAAMEKQVGDTIANQENSIKKIASDSVTAQSDAIKSQAQAAVDGQTDTIKNQAQTVVNDQAESIKGLAEATVDSQAEGIKAQAQAAVDGQADAIKAQAQATVDSQAEGIKAQAQAAVDGNFAQGQYDIIKNTASQKFHDTLTSEASVAALSASIKGNQDAYNVILNGVKTTMAQQVSAQAGRELTLTEAASVYGSMTGNDFAADAEAKADAIVGQMATAAVTGIADSASAMVGTSVADTAKTAAKTAAGEAAVSGAKTAAKEAAVFAAEQTKKTIASSIEKPAENGYSLVTGAKALAGGTQSLADSIPTLMDGISKLHSGSKTLVSNNAALNDGASKLKDGTGAITDGVNQLSDGAHELADGIVTFNEEGIEKVLNAYNGDIEPLMDRIQAVLDAGADYQTYTDIADGVNGSVKFIYKTDAIKAED